MAGSRFCYIGELNSAVPVNTAVIGDSHALAIMPAFAKLAEDRGEKFLFAVLGGCPPLVGIDVANGNFPPDVCPNWNRFVVDSMVKQGIKAVILVARWSLYTEGQHYGKPQRSFYLIDATHSAAGHISSHELFRGSFGATVETFQRLGVKIYVVEQLPQQPSDPRLHYLRLTSTGVIGTSTAVEFSRRLSVATDLHERHQRVSRNTFAEHAQKGLVTTINLDQHFCDAEVCLMGNGTFPFYQDRDHINAWMAGNLVSDLENALK